MHVVGQVGPIQGSGIAWLLAEVTRVTRPQSLHLVAGSPRSAHERERGNEKRRRRRKKKKEKEKEKGKEKSLLQGLWRP